jgi:hypothetical protein
MGELPRGGTTGGSIGFLAGNAFWAKSVKEQIKTVAVCSAEIVQLVYSGRHSWFVDALCEGLGIHLVKPIHFDEDNSAAIQLTEPDKQWKPTKFINQRFHVFADWVEQKHAVADKIDTALNPADFFTKALPLADFVRHRNNFMRVEDAKKHGLYTPVNHAKLFDENKQIHRALLIKSSSCRTDDSDQSQPGEAGDGSNERIAHISRRESPSSSTSSSPSARARNQTVELHENISISIPARARSLAPTIVGRVKLWLNLMAEQQEARELFFEESEDVMREASKQELIDRDEAHVCTCNCSGGKSSDSVKREPMEETNNSRNHPQQNLAPAMQRAYHVFGEEKKTEGTDSSPNLTQTQQEAVDSDARSSSNPGPLVWMFPGGIIFHHSLCPYIMRKTASHSKICEDMTVRRMNVSMKEGIAKCESSCCRNRW